MEAHAVGSASMDRVRLGPLRRLAGDDRLVAGVRAGQEDAFEAIFDRYHRPILSFCRHMLGNREESEDAVQGTFLSAYRDMVASDKPIQLRAWLYAIARNQCLSILRSRRESTPLEDVQPSVDGLGAEVQRRQDLRDMLADLARLPDDQRAALVLTEVGALSHEDVAGILHCPREKVKALVFQARSSLAASRTARETPCAEIREQLATLSGGALRRGTLRRHLRDCPGCREFQGQVRQQRVAMALLLPVVPSAGLKSAVLGAAGGGGAAAGGAAAGGGLGLSGLLGGGAAKLVVATVVVAGATGGGVAAVRAIEEGGGPSAKHATPARGIQGIDPSASTTSGPSGRSRATGDVPPGFAPTRARGEQAPAGQKDGVANGRLAKGVHGRSETALGKAGTTPGQAGTSPGQAGTTPGQAGTTPGATKNSPSRGADSQRSSGDRASNAGGAGGGGSTNAQSGGSAEASAGNVTAQGDAVTGRVLER